MKLQQLFDVSSLDRWIPTEVRQRSDEDLRRSRLALAFTAVLMVQCVVFSLTYAVLGLPQAAAAVVIAGALLLATPLVLKVSKSPSTAGLWVAGDVLLILLAISYFTGGPFAPAAWWMVVISAIALMVAGKRYALPMLIVEIVVFAIAVGMTLFHFPWPDLLDPVRRAALQFLGLAMLGVVVFALAWFFESAKERMLETLAARHDAMRRVLDNVGQGFLCVDPAGRLSDESSRVVREWFGPIEIGDALGPYLGARDPAFRAAFEPGWADVFENIMPIEVTLDQLPKRFTFGDRHLAVEYRPLMSGEQIEGMVMVLSDVTALVASEKSQAVQRELLAALDHVVHDRAGFRAFLENTAHLLEEITPGCDDGVRKVHTLKGNAGLFGASSIVEQCHAVETELTEKVTKIRGPEIQMLRETWSQYSERISRVLTDDSGALEISEQDFAALRSAIARSAPHAELARMVAELKHEPAQRPLARAAEQARALAERLGKGTVEVAVVANDVKLDPERWNGFWSAFAHAIRNAVDHGLESSDERSANGKPEVGSLRFTVENQGPVIEVALADDGRGIDWSRVAEKAKARGLPAESEHDLYEALFADGVSTRDEVTTISGRGVGLGALRDAARALGGDLDVTSERGRGTRISARIPAHGRPSWRLAS